MNKLSANSLNQARLEIKNRYLTGEPVPSIALSFNVSDRDIYYHLGKLTPQEKGLHAQNAGLKMIHRKEKHEKTSDASKSTKQEVVSGLDDFKQ